MPIIHQFTPASALKDLSHGGKNQLGGRGETLVYPHHPPIYTGTVTLHHVYASVSLEHTFYPKHSHLALPTPLNQFGTFRSQTRNFRVGKSTIFSMKLHESARKKMGRQLSNKNLSLKRVNQVASHVLTSDQNVLICQLIICLH